MGDCKNGRAYRCPRDLAFGYVVQHSDALVCCSGARRSLLQSTDTADALQQRRARGDAFSAVSLDNQLLCSARIDRSRYVSALAALALLRCAGDWWSRAVCAGAMACEQYLAPRLRRKLSDFHRAREYSSLCA